MKTIPKMYERVCEANYLTERLQDDIQKNILFSVQFNQDSIDNIYVMDIEEIVRRGLKSAQNNPREIVFLYDVLPDRTEIKELFSNLTEATNATVSLCSVDKKYFIVRITIIN